MAEPAGSGKQNLAGVPGLLALLVPALEKLVVESPRVLVNRGGVACGFAASLLGSGACVRLASLQRGECLLAPLAQGDHLGDSFAQCGGGLSFALAVGLFAPRLAQFVEHLVERTGDGVAGGRLGGAPGGGRVRGRPGRGRTRRSTARGRRRGRSATRWAVLRSRPRVMPT